MYTLGGLALIMCAFIVPPIVLLNRSSIRSRWIWLPAIPCITIGTYLGIMLGPIMFSGMSRYSRIEWPSLHWHGVMLLCGFGFALLMSVTLVLVKRRQETERLEGSEKIHKAIDNILADGVVEGPKGPRVPHKKWNVGTEARTPHETKGRSGSGPYGGPRP
jgi:hypothetical protein